VPASGAKPRREQIIDESTHLFAEHGYEGTSIRIIARACGITEAAIYRHFDSKAHLYEEVIRMKAREYDIAGHLAQLDTNLDLESVLTGMAEHILALAGKDPELMRLMFSNSLENGDSAAVLFREIRLPYITFLTEELTQRIAHSEVRKVDPFITSRCFVGMVMDCGLNVGVWSKIDTTEFHAGDVVCNNVPIFARGLLNEASSL